jgi:hypothetical protein
MKLNILLIFFNIIAWIYDHFRITIYRLAAGYWELGGSFIYHTTKTKHFHIRLDILKVSVEVRIGKK